MQSSFGAIKDGSSVRIEMVAGESCLLKVHFWQESYIDNYRVGLIATEFAAINAL